MSSKSEALVTRDLVTFKRVHSPLSTIQANLFTLLQNPVSIDLRATFLSCLSDSEGNPDSALLDHFEQPPQLALVQGTVDPSLAINQWTASKGSSSASSTASTRIETVSTSNSASSNRRVAGRVWTHDLAPDDVREVIFLPWSNHQCMEEARERGDAKEEQEAAVFALAGIIYETAHWLYERTHGHRAQESLRPFKGSASEREQIVEARKSQDVGMRVLSRTMGADYELLTTADGIATLVRLRLPAPDPPLFRASAISSLIGAPMPKVLDGTAFGTTRVGTSPLWLHSPFVVIKVEPIGASCHHGVTDCQTSSRTGKAI